MASELTHTEKAQAMPFSWFSDTDNHDRPGGFKGILGQAMTRQVLDVPDKWVYIFSVGLCEISQK